MNSIIDMIAEQDFKEFEELVMYARKNDYLLLELIVDRTYFFSRLLDSRRYSSERSIKKIYKELGDGDE